VPPSTLKRTEQVITTKTEMTPINLPPLTGARWSCTTIGGETTVVFQYGLFSEGSELTATARQDLGTIASSLKGKRFHLEVEGHTDSTAMLKSKSNGSNNKALGLLRARKVNTYLTQQCGLPPERITVSSAGEFRPPFPNTTAENRKMNRTVVLKVREM
jgi:chemotaxis protein MotB